jgi:metal-dependent HD superfamily phosphatase/phosphodiesterase
MSDENPNDSVMGDFHLVTAEEVLHNREVLQLISLADSYLEAIGYTDHGLPHVTRVAQRAAHLLEQLGYPAREVELAKIAGYLHDIGNVVHRRDHAQTGAILSIQLLSKMGMDMTEIARIAGAIANHDEGTGEPFSPLSAALIIGDKTDVLRGRVRNPRMIQHDIHDRVNYAATQSVLTLSERRVIILELTVDTSISPVVEYFEIFMSRMAMCRRSAEFLNCGFRLIINGVSLS